MTAQVQRTDVTKWIISVDQKGTGQITLADLRSFLLATDDLPDSLRVHVMSALPHGATEREWSLHVKHEGIAGAEEQ